MPEAWGIDFGTTNSVVARLVEEPTRHRIDVVPSELGEPVTPSAVAVDWSGRWLFGRAAKEADTEDRAVSVKPRLGEPDKLRLGGRDLRPEAIAALLFRHLARQAEEATGATLESAVVTVPANAKGLQRQATQAAAAAAGIRTLTLINEPTAAALAYGLGRHDGRELKVLVYDFGGGTLDVTVLRAHHGIFEEVASRGLRRCGGDDVDQALADHLVRTHLPSHAEALAADYPALRLRLACEQAKTLLSTQPTTRVDLEDLLPGVHLHAALDRGVLLDLANPTIERTGEPVREALAAAGMVAGELDHLLLVGGTSRMPAVREYVERLLARPAEPLSAADPITCVASGAAIVAGILQRSESLREVDYQVCLEHSLCIAPVDPMTGRRFLEPIVASGTKIPARNTRTYFPVADYSAEVSVRIYEGNVPEPIDHAENVKLGEVRVPLQPPRPADQCPIEVTFAYADDGLLTATARDVGQDRIFQVVIDAGGQALDDLARREVRDLLTQVFGAPPPDRGPAPAVTEPEALRRARQRLAETDRVLAKLDDDGQTAELRNRAAALRAAIDDGETAAVESADRHLAAELIFFDYLL